MIYLVKSDAVLSWNLKQSHSRRCGVDLLIQIREFGLLTFIEKCKAKNEIQNIPSWEKMRENVINHFLPDKSVSLAKSWLIQHNLGALDTGVATSEKSVQREIVHLN